MADLVAAVDVGTGSARAGLFDRSGRLLARSLASIAMRRPAQDRAEQNSDNIWRAVAAALRAAMSEAGAAPGHVAGLGFDATCSLVLRDRSGRPLGSDPDAPGDWDTLVWLDHRARAEADACTATGHPLLARHGGAMSPEMQIPKLLWLKRHRPERWRLLGAAFDLADFLTWKATGSPVRSACTLACKWSAEPDGGWAPDFLAAIGLEDIVERCALPPRPALVGSALGRLTEAAAAVLGLSPGCAVATGLVDAHAGALAALGRFAGDPAIETQRVLITGTSSCIMGLSAAPHPIPALWGPHRDVALPGYWLSEGGQSASGALLNHLCRTWTGSEPDEALHARVLARVAERIAEEGPDLAPRLHVLPDFHGNRAPFADPHALGVVSGLALDASFDGLCELYWRSCVGLALGLRQILDHQAAHGWPADRLHIAGGHARSPLLLQLYADATGLPLEAPAAPDLVLLGTAMAAAAAAGVHPDLATAAGAMCQPTATIAPQPESRPRLERDHAAFLMLQRHRAELEALLRPGVGDPGEPGRAPAVVALAPAQGASTGVAAAMQHAR